MGVELEDRDRALLDGQAGDGAALAMRLVVRMAEVARAPQLRDVTGAHIDSCLYHGQVGLDFAERLLAGGAKVAVPATLNVSSLDLLHPELVRLDDETRERARRLMDTYVAMGCRPTWTCAPYQLPDRPAFGEHVAWAESNAIVFANSVLGARTNRYGDFIDICAAVTGRVPDHGLHTDEGRRATLLLRLDDLTDRLLDHDLLAPVLGHLLGRRAGNEVAAIEGLPADTTEDRLKAIGAAAASSGAVALFHAIGVTLEAPTWESVAAAGAREEPVTLDDLRAARDELSPVPDGAEIGAVSVGTPHASEVELRRLVDLVRRGAAAGALLREHESRATRRARVGRGRARRRRRHRRYRHLHVHHADPARRLGTRDDRFRQVGLVRAQQPRLRGRPGQHAGVRAICGRRRRHPRRRSVGRPMNGGWLVEARASGPALVLDEPLSFWGGLDPVTGEIVEANHPQRGVVVSGRMLVMPSGRGSSSSATVLAEAIRLGTGPAGIVLGEPDHIIAIGVLVASELYGITIPVFVASPDGYATIRDGDAVSLLP